LPFHLIIYWCNLYRLKLKFSIILFDRNEK
jgi:hypothetical protein